MLKTGDIIERQEDGSLIIDVGDSGCSIYVVTEFTDGTIMIKPKQREENQVPIPKRPKWKAIEVPSNPVPFVVENLEDLKKYTAKPGDVTVVLSENKTYICTGEE